MTHPRRGWRWRIFVMTLSTMVTLITLEFAFRLFSSPEPPIPRDSRENALAVDRSRNAFNLREPWGEIPSGADAVRIAFLGDSFTFGASVEPEACFVHLVEERLNEERDGHFVTINMGQPGTDPMMQSRIYEEHRGRWRIDVVVHVLYCNDLGHDLYEELKIIHALQNRRSFAADWSYVWRFVEGRVRYRMVRKRTLDYFRGGDSPLDREQAWLRLREGVERVKSMAEADGASYVLVMFPWLYELDEYPLEGVHDRMGRLAEEVGVPYLDLLETFDGEDAMSLRISVIDEHPNPRAHEMSADAIARFLNEHILERGR